MHQISKTYSQAMFCVLPYKRRGIRYFHNEDRLLLAVLLMKVALTPKCRNENFHSAKYREMENATVQLPSEKRKSLLSLNSHKLFFVIR